MTKVHHIAVDGGPCAGKTSILASSFRELEDQGFSVFVVPEAASMLIGSGIHPNFVGNKLFQKLILDLQFQNEEYWRNIAKTVSFYRTNHIIVFYDRGLLTGNAYIYNDLEAFQRLTRERLNLSVEEIRSRYDAVLHLVTAADGAEEFYNFDNSARSETPEQAKVLDGKTKNAWLGHRHLRIVSNQENGQKINFDQKKHRFLQEVFNVIGYPEPLEREDRYLLKTATLSNIQLNKIEIMQIYLSNDSGVEERLRVRESFGFKSYYHTFKQSILNSSDRIEHERKISKKEYEELLLRRDVKHDVIQKNRYCFLYEDQYFEVDYFQGRHEGLIICERERTNVNQSTILPPFLEVDRDITSDKSFSNFELSKKR